MLLSIFFSAGSLRVAPTAVSGEGILLSIDAREKFGLFFGPGEGSTTLLFFPLFSPLISLLLAASLPRRPLCRQSLKKSKRATVFPWFGFEARRR